MADLPFYHQGLRFTCQQCHNCCRGAQAGGVYPSRPEVKRIARWLKLTVHTFRDRYLRPLDGAPSLRIRPNGDCVFWDQGCTVYPVRPRQCRTFPFWPENLISPEAWKEATRTCHGAGSGRLYRLEDIRSVLRGRATAV
ncbi:MAG: YkgJ family cysteine cluster protein [Vicinamibacteria bacterium]